MGKIVVLAVSENEEYIFSNIQRYLQLEVACTDISCERDMILDFSGLEIDIYHREVRYNKNLSN